MNRFMMLFVLLALFQLSATAQVKFLHSGTIEFERKINIQRQVTNDAYGWMKAMAEKLPQYQTTTFSLSFTDQHALYRPVPGPPVNPIHFLGPAKENQVYTDFAGGTTESRKSIYDQNFVVIDSLRKIEWVMSDELRTIAGLECRKAVGRICDSVYVVAFYAEEIPVSGGPESFSGLPGMILGLAIPRLYTTWFATKVSMNSTAGELPKSGRRDEKVDRQKLENVLTSSLKDWGPMAQKYIWWGLL